MKTDTIAAIATGLTEAGIGIVRISGNQAIEAADRIFRTKGGKRILQKAESHTVHYGYIVDTAEEDIINWKDFIVDEVLATVLKAPKSYTAEDTVEISCHGGILVVKKVLETVLKNGARLAEPGEFTKRAFLNGRIDLTKAEAVIDIIQSQNQWALASSVNQLKGSVSDKIKDIRAKILYEIAFIESALDDPEHISLDGYPQSLLVKLENLMRTVKKLIDSADYGKMMKEGINTVIVGKPNVGKSSLLNVVVGEDRAIVTEVAGTTRDVLQESVLLRGISLHIMDTAGIHTTEDIVEKIGVEKARNLAGKADLILFVVDASVPLEESDREICKMISSKNAIILLNKSDLTCIVEEKDIREMVTDHNVRIIRISALNNTGIEELENAIEEMFFQGKLAVNNEVTITSLRHKEALQNAYEDLQRVKQSILDSMPEDFYSIDLMGAYTALGTIIGEEVREDLINEIFSRFCMGK